MNYHFHKCSKWKWNDPNCRFSPLHPSTKYSKYVNFINLQSNQVFSYTSFIYFKNLKFHSKSYIYLVISEANGDRQTPDLASILSLVVHVKNGSLPVVFQGVDHHKNWSNFESLVSLNKCSSMCVICVWGAEVVLSRNPCGVQLLTDSQLSKSKLIWTSK